MLWVYQLVIEDVVLREHGCPPFELVPDVLLIALPHAATNGVSLPF